MAPEASSKVRASTAVHGLPGTSTSSSRFTRVPPASLRRLSLFCRSTVGWMHILLRATACQISKFRRFWRRFAASQAVILSTQHRSRTREATCDVAKWAVATSRRRQKSEATKQNTAKTEEKHKDDALFACRKRIPGLIYILAICCLPMAISPLRIHLLLYYYCMHFVCLGRRLPRLRKRAPHIIQWLDLYIAWLRFCLLPRN